MAAVLCCSPAAAANAIKPARTVSLRAEKPLFLGSRVGTRKAGVACVLSDAIFGHDFLQVQDVEFLVKQELGRAKVTLVDASQDLHPAQIDLSISLEKISAQVCSPSVGLFGGGDKLRGKVTFTFLVTQRIGNKPVRPVRAMDVIVDTRVRGEPMRQDEFFPRAVHLVCGWLLEDWGWSTPVS
jgi:hypothetical protein